MGKMFFYKSSYWRDSSWTWNPNHLDLWQNGFKNKSQEHLRITSLHLYKDCYVLEIADERAGGKFLGMPMIASL